MLTVVINATRTETTLYGETLYNEYYNDDNGDLIEYDNVSRIYLEYCYEDDEDEDTSYRRVQIPRNYEDGDTFQIYNDCDITLKEMLQQFPDISVIELNVKGDAKLCIWNFKSLHKKAL